MYILTSTDHGLQKLPKSAGHAHNTVARVTLHWNLEQQLLVMVLLKLRLFPLPPQGLVTVTLGQADQLVLQNFIDSCLSVCCGAQMEQDGHLNKKTYMYIHFISFTHDDVE